MEKLSKNRSTVKAPPEAVLPFGKYRGRSVREIAVIDPDYAESLLDTVTKLKRDLTAAVWWRQEGWIEE